MPTTQHARRKACYFSGHVQGVGFRYTVKNVALRHDVRGYVKNLPDGRVELVMEGDDREMDQLLTEVCNRMTDYIRKIDTNILPATNEFSQFCIKH